MISSHALLKHYDLIVVTNYAFHPFFTSHKTTKGNVAILKSQGDHIILCKTLGGLHIIELKKFYSSLNPFHPNGGLNICSAHMVNNCNSN